MHFEPGNIFDGLLYVLNFDVYRAYVSSLLFYRSVLSNRVTCTLVKLMESGSMEDSV